MRIHLAQVAEKHLPFHKWESEGNRAIFQARLRNFNPAPIGLQAGFKPGIAGRRLAMAGEILLQLA
ncbi:MAG: hypothetical protein ACLQQ0_16560, partial [Limisphaerales bacterium]